MLQSPAESTSLSGSINLLLPIESVQSIHLALRTHISNKKTFFYRPKGILRPHRTKTFGKHFTENIFSETRNLALNRSRNPTQTSIPWRNGTHSFSRRSGVSLGVPIALTKRSKLRTEVVIWNSPATTAWVGSCRRTMSGLPDSKSWKLILSLSIPNKRKRADYFHNLESGTDSNGGRCAQRGRNSAGEWESSWEFAGTSTKWRSEVPKKRRFELWRSQRNQRGKYSKNVLGINRS